MKAKLFNNEVEILGSIGDCNAIDHDGGFVYENEYGPQILWIESDDDSDEEDAMLTVYRSDVPENVVTDNSWAKWEDITKGQNMSVLEYEFAFAANADPMKRACAIWDLASHWGWNSIDHYPLRMTRKEAEEKYGAALDAANERKG